MSESKWKLLSVWASALLSGLVLESALESLWPSRSRSPWDWTLLLPWALLMVCWSLWQLRLAWAPRRRSPNPPDAA